MIEKLLEKAYRALFILIATFSFTNSAHATHIRAGEIKVERTNCPAGRDVRITIIAYTDTQGASPPVLFGDGFLDFGDDTDPLFIPVGNVITRDVDGEEGVAYNEVSVTHTYRGNNFYTISYRELNRNENVLNIFNSVQTPFYVETRILIDATTECNNSPVLTVPPIDRGCTGVAFTHNAGAFDPDGDSLSYEFTVPRSDVGTDVINYRDPNAQEFYGGVNFNTANETATGPPTFTINSINGDVTWDAPGSSIGEYNIAFRIIEWRKIGDRVIPLGYVTRDMQIIIEECNNERPELEIPQDTCVIAGTLLEAVIVGTDPDGDAVELEAFSQVFNLVPAATVDSADLGLQPSPGELRFSWQTSCSHIREQPYQVTFKVTDNPTPIPGQPPRGAKLATLRTWNIRVVPPPPVLLSAVVAADDPFAIDLAIENYEENGCDNAETIQVWRRVDSFMINQDTCDMGMPPNAGYELIDRIPINATSYRDDNDGEGLNFGARYCYRLVAEYINPDPLESMVSEEQCADPIVASAPIITNVTVDRTDVEDGQITVRWLRPFELDTVNVLPPPFIYTVFRAEGFEGGATEQVGQVMSDDDALFIEDTGLNTEGLPYRYWISITSDDPSDTVIVSDTASSVRLTPIPQFRGIRLEWEADVPWSNNIQSRPYHLIFRGDEDDRDDELVLIDSIDVGMNGFTYLDEGQFNNEPLDENVTYCYRIETRGSYGNPDIDEPLLNFSQTVCSQPSDSIAPCAPILFFEPIVCGAFCEEDSEAFFNDKPCGFAEFSNELKWLLSDPECAEDIQLYRVYYSSTSDTAGFEVIAEVPALGLNTDTVRYTHVDPGGLRPSFKGCYRITAVDRSGNESTFSNTECNDNCPNYCLPNVFTPTIQGRGNDIFMAFNDRIPSGEVRDGGEIFVEIDEFLCPRFVESIQFTVVNRWGKEVFTYSGSVGQERSSILINWDGRNDSGRLLSAGVYFYLAEVTFDVLDPEKRRKDIKGWVHVLY